MMAETGNYAGGKGHFCQLNSLWSVWYGLLATVLNVYSVLLATRRLSGKKRFNQQLVVSILTLKRMTFLITEKLFI